MLLPIVDRINAPHGSDTIRHIRIKEGQWVVRCEVGTIYEYDPDAQAHFLRWQDCSKVVGIRDHQVEQHILKYGLREYSHGGQKKWIKYVYIGNNPFGVVVSVQDRKGNPAGGKMLVCARRCTKGCIGKMMQIKTPRFVRRQFAYSTVAGDIRIDGWTRLKTAARFAGMNEQDMLERYYGFTHKVFPVLHVVRADNPDEIKRKIRPVERFTREDIPDLIARDAQTTWIPKNFTDTILRCVRLRYIPT